MTKILLILILTLTSMFTAYTVTAAEFPRDKVAYVCDTEPYYYTTDFDSCMLEQYGWHSAIVAMGLSQSQYVNALWYGKKYGYMGDVIGIDFKPVLQRAQYLERQE